MAGILLRHGASDHADRSRRRPGHECAYTAPQTPIEGITFRELENETFGVLAEELLAAGLSVAQVAARLGYSSSSALTHAFKSWKGMAPGSFARSRRQDVNGGVSRDGSRAE